MSVAVQKLLYEAQVFQDEMERSVYYYDFLLAISFILAVFILCWSIFTAPYVLLFISLFFIQALVNLREGIQRLDRYERKIEARAMKLSRLGKPFHIGK